MTDWLTDYSLTDAHNIIDWLTLCFVLLQNFAAQIVYNRPDNPLQYLVDELERSREDALQVTKESKDSVTPSPDLFSWQLPGCGYLDYTRTPYDEVVRES